jgi:D-3-phosphoglycerate dehydrogenase
MKIVIADDYQHAVDQLACRSLLAGHDVTVYHDVVTDPAVVVQRFSAADAVVLIRERTRMPRELLAQLPNLRLVSQTGHAAAHVDLEACTEMGIAVSGAGTSSDATAELTWALILAAKRKVVSEAVGLRAGRWQSSLGQSVRGLTLGIYGYGNIGSRVARFGKAFGMRVVTHGGREASQARAQADGVEIIESREAFFAQADVLTLHVRSNAATRGIIKAADLAAMKSTALFVNTSRAQLVEAGALLAALKAGRPGFAAIDVFDSEPILGATDPLLAMDNVLCTPHLGYAEATTYEEFFGPAFEAINAMASGTPINLLNPAVIGRLRAR